MSGCTGVCVCDSLTILVNEKFHHGCLPSTVPLSLFFFPPFLSVIFFFHLLRFSSALRERSETVRATDSSESSSWFCVAVCLAFLCCIYFLKAPLIQTCCLVLCLWLILANRDNQTLTAECTLNKAIPSPVNGGPQLTQLPPFTQRFLMGTNQVSAQRRDECCHVVASTQRVESKTH